MVFSVSLILFYKNITRHLPGKRKVWKESGDRVPWNGEKKMRAGVQSLTSSAEAGGSAVAGGTVPISFFPELVGTI